jgi:hypothetical protein
VHIPLVTVWLVSVQDPKEEHLPWLRTPFPIHGVVTRPAFTDRVEEVERIRNTLEEPGAKLLVYGPRRMGKTSALRVAIEDHLARGGVACLADFSTATSHGDLANRVLTASTQALGRRWKDIVHDLSRRIGLTLEVSADPVTGGPTASLGFGMRSASRAAEQETLGRVLDSLDGLCEARGVSLGLILDEFQEIHRLGGEEGEWHKDIARWILALAGERTRDVAQLARKTFQLARKEGRADAGTVKQAFLEIIADESEPLRALWASYAGTEEKVLRAVATGTESLMAADTLQRFGLASSAAASKAAANLVAEGVLVQEGPGNYRFDSPFQRGWVIQQALPDAGIHLPPTHPVEL